ncbi:MAG: MlaD family protein [Deltaproteobacteria bacterium]|jgi:phospholipid/cholesterol/gamma-HCH transport system substrate-binding protein|nr:MlaD family protein [Deltaproteobacteria bacterium]
METRASYMLVGVFSLLIVMGSLLFVLWTAKNSEGDLRTYEIIFRQSVSGLSVGSAVTLEGVRVGQVSSINVHPHDPGQVVVYVQVAADAPIRQNSQAALEPQGVTGVSQVGISGGTAESPMLAEIKGVIGRIPSRPSRLQEIMNSVPSILGSLDSLAKRGNQLFSVENTEAAGRLLLSIAEIADTLAENRESIAKGLAGFGTAGQSFAVAGKRLESLMAEAQQLLDKDMRGAARSVDKAAARFDALVSAAEPGMARFSRESAEELQRLLVEGRRLLTGLARLAQNLESDPRRFLLGNSVPEFSAP